MSEIDKDKMAEIKETAAEAQEQVAAFMEPGQKVKAKKGRPPGSKTKKVVGESPSKKAAEPTQAAPEVPTSQILKMPLQMLSQAAVKYTEHPQAAMTPDELNGMADCLGALLDKYMPNAFNAYGLEIATVMVVGQYGLRVAACKRAVDQAKEKAKENPGPKTSEIVPTQAPISREENVGPRFNENADVVEMPRHGH